MTRREYDLLERWLEAGEGVPVEEPDELVVPLFLHKRYLEKVGPDRYALTAFAASQAERLALRGKR